MLNWLRVKLLTANCPKPLGTFLLFSCEHGAAYGLKGPRQVRAQIATDKLNQHCQPPLVGLGVWSGLRAGSQTVRGRSSSQGLSIADPGRFAGHQDRMLACG